MADRLGRSFLNRSLLTDTLPYEVPVIFSNDRFHAGLSATVEDKLRAVLDRMFDQRTSYTVPYNYKITKAPGRTTTLSVVHPLMQREVSNFYELHGSGMLSHCARSRFSLRKPVLMASPFARDPKPNEPKDKSGIPELLADSNESDMSHMSSYYTYGKYNLLGKFIASREYIRLETRYRYMRQIDISKCFYNIYTHSITWAVKDKAYAKQQKENYSFEARFDKIMQRCNYNETNGIVVGPEFSRIFAEIILQDVDVSVEGQLLKEGLSAGRHYDMRRYVDDFFVFSNDLTTLDFVEACVRKNLEEYKLYINDKKIITKSRPFVSPLTLAREEVGEKLREISASLAQIKPDSDPLEIGRLSRMIRSKINQIRISIAKYNIDLANISGWLMARLKRVIRRSLSAIKEIAEPSVKEHMAEISVSALQAALYICSVDLRVRSTYSICQISLLFHNYRDALSEEHSDLIWHSICEQITGMIKFRLIEYDDTTGIKDDVELFNLLICGSQFVGNDFLSSDTVSDTFKKMIASPRMTYFKYITLVFCLRKDKSRFSNFLEQTNFKARERVCSNHVDVLRDTEEFLIAIDYLSSPDVPSDHKQSFYQEVFKQQNLVSKSVLEKIGTYAGFTDWTGVSVEHQLMRKELRPVYAWG